MLGFVMRVIENYEIVLSGEEEDRLLLTFDCADAPHLPRAATATVFDSQKSEIRVVFEDQKHWEEIQFPNLPSTLHDVLRGFEKISVVGLSDQVEIFSETALEIR